jgi:gluconate 2-dehydrogenase alpha chain
VTDVLLIGLGGANGIVADVLTAAGLDVVALEAGGRLTPSQMRLDEVRNDRREWLAQAKSQGELPTWRSTPDDVAGPSPWPLRMVNAVGGSTVHYPGLSARLAPWNLRARSATAERYGPAAIPAGCTLTDWPFSYDELEPYYDAIEHEVGVAGRSGANPFEGARTRDLPMPELRPTGWTQLTERAATELGWHPFPAPAALNSVPRDGRAACTYCGFCTSNGCHVDAKNHTAVTHIPRAEATGRLRIVTGARVTRIDSGPDGRATGATYVEGGREHHEPARVVVLGTFVYENVRLLLLSGLANASGQVGAHYIAHVVPTVHGLFEGRDLALFGGPWTQATCFEDLNADNFDHAGLGFIGGGMCSVSHEVKPIAAASITPPPGVPDWGAAWKAWLARHGRSVGTAIAQLDALPYEDHRLDLDPRTRDAHGLPVVRATFAPRENERRAAAWLGERLHAWLRQAGATQTWEPAGPLTIEPRHAYGGTRMGDDPATSVVDRFGFAHDVPNLAVVGASTFPTAGGLNPTLTLQALALRTARHLVASWDGRAGRMCPPLIRQMPLRRTENGRTVR